MQVEISTQTCDMGINEYFKGHISDKTLAYLNRRGLTTVRDFIQVCNELPKKVSIEAKAYLMFGMENFYN